MFINLLNCESQQSDVREEEYDWTAVTLEIKPFFYLSVALSLFVGEVFPDPYFYSLYVY